ncbi:MAG: TldD/PmbA family protein [Asgard group archaeon]|nr:TldD/PmbA family protein [Asgard group archaeon]
MNSDFSLHDLAEKVIRIGLSKGADQVEAYTLYGAVRGVQIERGSIRRFTDTSNSGIGIRILKNKATGMASTTIFSQESIEKTVSEAVSLAKISPPDTNFISLPSDTTPTPIIPDRCDDNISELSIEDFTELILATIQEAKIREDAIIGGNFSAGKGERYIINSAGVDRFSMQTSVSGFLSTKISEGDDIGSSYHYDAQTTLKKFDYLSIGKLSGERALKMLGAQKIDTTNLPILMDPETTYGTLAPILANGINAFNVFNRTAFFVDKIGDQIGSPKLSVFDDPLYPGGVDSAPFDDEGVVPKKIQLVEEGILQTYITDSYTAPLVELENTGHASRFSFASKPRPSPYSLNFKNGDISKDAILSDLKEGILLIDSSLESSGNRPQISDQINQGFYVKDGEIQYPVKEAVVGCTVYDIFDKIEEVSKETENRSGHIAPWILLSPIRISGGK